MKKTMKLMDKEGIKIFKDAFKNPGFKDGLEEFFITINKEIILVSGRNINMKNIKNKKKLKAIFVFGYTTEKINNVIDNYIKFFSQINKYAYFIFTIKKAKNTKNKPELNVLMGY